MTLPRPTILGGIFSLSHSVCISSIVKLSYVWNPEDPEVVDVSPAMLWSSVQLGVAILCACLPTFAPLLRLARQKLGASSDGTKTYGYSQRAKSNNLITQGSVVNTDITASPYYRVQDDPLDTRHTHISNDSSESYKMEGLGSHAIHVKRSVDIV